MKQHPILFSTPMVQAILEGRKTMTRRIIKPQPIDNTEEDGNFFEGNHKGYVKVDGHPYWRDQFVHEFSKKQVGDVLWVKQSFTVLDWWDEDMAVEIRYEDAKSALCYLDDDEWKKFEKWKDKSGKKSSLFMFKSMSSIWLEITGIRVERLQDISPGDACCEGIEYWNIDWDALEGGELQADFKNYTWTEKKEADPNYEDRWFPTFANPIDSFRTLWQSINGADSWSANPWVWVISFRKIEKP